jgi:lipoate-protein ligase A
MSEEQNTEMSEQEMFDAMLKQLQQTMDPRDFMTPTQREIAYMTTEELEEAYQQVQARTSGRGRMQRDLIISRYEYEQQKQKQDENNV